MIAPKIGAIKVVIRIPIEVVKGMAVEGVIDVPRKSIFPSQSTSAMFASSSVCVLFIVAFHVIS